MDGRSGDRAAGARRFAARLHERGALPVELLDERWTTREAEAMLRDTQPGGRKARKQRKEQVDAVAASIILRTFLDQRGTGGVS